MKGEEFARGQAQGNDSSAASLLNQQVKHVKFVVEVDVFLDALLEAGLKNHVTGAIRRVTRPAHRSLPVVARMTAKRPLGNFAVWSTAEGQPPMLEVVNRLHRLAAQDLGSILIH